jgi:uncharacterized protein
MSWQTVRSLLWNRRDEISLEYFELQQGASGIRLKGTVLTLAEKEPLRLEYTVDCDRAWVTRSVRINLIHASAPHELTLSVDDQRRWWCDGREITAVTGCFDFDINLSPSTNTLPIRRLALARGGESDVTAAWIRFPELTVEPLPQRYVRSGDRLYRYSSNGGEFTADIEVDELGLVVSYPPLWERVGSAATEGSTPV